MRYKDLTSLSPPSVAVGGDGIAEDRLAGDPTECTAGSSVAGIVGGQIGDIFPLKDVEMERKF